MNKQPFILKITVLLLALLSNELSFGMKRAAEEQISTLQPEQKKIHRAPKEYFDKTLAFCTQPLRIDILKGQTLKNKMSLDNLSADDKINCLCVFDNKRRDHIDKVQVERFQNLCSVGKNEALKIINDATAKINNQNLNDEVNAENALVEFFEINAKSQEWQNHMQELREKEELHILSMKSPHNSATWSVDLPDNIITSSTRAIKENGFDPAAFDIVFSDAKTSFRESIHQCREAGSCKLGRCRPARFYFNQTLANVSDKALFYTECHELIHALKNHTTRRSFIVDSIVKIKGSDYKNVILNSWEYAQYLLAQETTADTMLALTNSEIARNSLHVKTHYPNSYGILKTVNTHLDVLEHFDQKKSNILTITSNRC